MSARVKNVRQYVAFVVVFNRLVKTGCRCWRWSEFGRQSYARPPQGAGVWLRVHMKSCPQRSPDQVGPEFALNFSPSPVELSACVRLVKHWARRTFTTQFARDAYWCTLQQRSERGLSVFRDDSYWRCEFGCVAGRVSYTQEPCIMHALAYCPIVTTVGTERCGT